VAFSLSRVLFALINTIPELSFLQRKAWRKCLCFFSLVPLLVSLALPLPLGGSEREAIIQDVRYGNCPLNFLDLETSHTFFD